VRLTKQQLRSLEPVRNDLDDPVEPPSIYARRVQSLLPNFPEQVITQWFYEHEGVIEQRAGLDYSSLQFEEVAFGERELQLPCLAEHETVVQYRNHFLGFNTSRRMQRLADYIQAHGTWPVAPIVLNNSDGQFVESWGFKYSVPYDLLEGHHRMAVLYALGKHKRGQHLVWLVTRSFEGRCT
jgi:hypothetical protein